VDYGNSESHVFNRHHFQVVDMGTAEFSRGVALTRGASTLAPDALMFFTDVDMLFTCDALDRIRLNTVHGAQVVTAFIC